MNLLLSVVLGGIVDLAERCRAWLLVHRHDLSTEERIDKCRFARVEIASDEDFRGCVFDTRSESVEMADGARDAVVQEIGDRRLFELRYERRGG